MKDFSESTYGDRIADVYDELYGDLAGPELVDPMVDVLADLAGGGRALELGIGTGRIALPLAARGVEVHGIDASEAMVEKMRRKPGGDLIPVAMGGLRGRGRKLLASIRRLQYLLRSAHPGSPGPVLPQRRPPPVRGRSLPAGGIRS